MSAKRLVIVGSGNGGRITLDIARALRLDVFGFVRSDLAQVQVVNGAPVLGDDALLEYFVSANSFAVWMGPQAVRRRLALNLIESGADLPPLVHPSCVVSEHARIGRGSIVAAGAIVNWNANIGRFCIVNAGATIERDCLLDDGTLISPGVHFGGSTICGEGAFVGIGACTVAGIRTGKVAVMGAGSVVIRDVADSDVVAGNPAKSLKKDQ